MPESVYYIQKDENEMGPLSFAQMRTLWGRGEITVRTSFRYENENIWRPVALLQSELDEPMEMPPVLPAQKPKKAGADIKTGCGCLFFGIVLVIIILSAGNRNQSAISPLDYYPPVKATSQHAESPAPTITWKEIDEFFYSGEATDLQRQEKAKLLKGQHVAWQGWASKVEEKFWGLQISFKMNKATITNDVALDLNDSEKGNAVKVKTGDYMSFSGTIEDIRWGLFGEVKLKNGALGKMLTEPEPATKTAEASKQDGNQDWQEKTIKGHNWIGATSQELFKKLVTYKTQKDAAAFGKVMNAGLQTGDITLFKDGEKVLLMDTALFSGLVKVRRRGKVTEYWTHYEMVK